MRKFLAILLGSVMVISLAVAQEGMQVNMVKEKSKKAKQTKNKFAVNNKNLGKNLALKATGTKSKNKKKTVKKAKKSIDPFANVEYNVAQKKSNDISGELSDISELSDLERIEKYESRFEENEGKKAKKRREKLQPTEDLGILAENVAPVQEQKEKAPKKKMSKQLENDLKPLSTYEFDTSPEFDESARISHSKNNEKETEQYVQPKVVASRDVVEKKNVVRADSVYSQSAKSSSWITLMPVGGYGSFNMVNGQDRTVMGAQDFQNSQSYLGGVLADLGRGRWNLETGLLYVRVGVKRDVNQASMFGGMGMMGAGYTEYDDRDYVVAPIMGVFNFMEKTGTSVFAKAGIWPMYLTTAKQEIYSSMSPQTTMDVSANYQKFDVLGSVGAGGRMYIGDSMAIIVEGYYLRGFQNTFNNSYMSGNTQGFMGNIAISFDL